MSDLKRRAQHLWRWLALGAIITIMTINISGLIQMNAQLSGVSETKRGGLLWNSDQLEYEFLRFNKTLLGYIAGHPTFEESDVALRFDILWSRHTISERDQSRLGAHTSADTYGEVLENIGQLLRTHESNISALSLLTTPELQKMVDEFESLETPIHDLTIVLKDRQASLDETVRKDAVQMSTMTIAYSAILGIGAFIVVVVFLIESRAQQESRLENARLTKETQAAYLAKIEFLSTVSHELRTPLTSINGVLAFLRQGVLGDLNTQGHRFVEIASKNSRKLEKIINDVLDLVKAERGQLNYAFEEVDISKCVAHAADANISYQAGRSIEIDDQLSEDIVVWADQSRIDQVFANLISNAIKFSDPRHPIKITCKREADWVHVSVKDFGIGIPENFKTRVFESFAQADSSDTRSVGGTGLGLNIAKQIVEKHNGQLWFDSEMGRGTTFTFSLPIKHQESSAVPDVPPRSASLETA